MRRALAVAPLLLALALPASAAAQEPAPTGSGLPPVQAKIKLTLQRVGKGGVLARRRWIVKGTVRPYVAGQTVTVRLHRRGRKVAARRLKIRRSGADGLFRFGYRTTTPGRITVSASHRATAEMATAVARRVNVEVLPLRAMPGSRGQAVRVLQRRLRSLAYVVRVSGYYDDRTARAVMAFRKLTGMARTYMASEEVFRRLGRGQGRFKVRYPGHGRHVEGDLTHQVLALIDDGRAVRIYPMSSGKPSTPTVRGSFRVYEKEPGTNAKGMIFPSFFIRGYAIHGYVEVPPYPASHGCLRVPPADAVSIYNWLDIGTPVDVYYR